MMCYTKKFHFLKVLSMLCFSALVLLVSNQLALFASAITTKASLTNALASTNAESNTQAVTTSSSKATTSWRFFGNEVKRRKEVALSKLFGVPHSIRSSSGCKVMVIPNGGGGSDEDQAVRDPCEDDEKNGKIDVWDEVECAEPDSILGIAQAFRECTDPRKVNVCVGAYRDNEGRPWVLPSVQIAEQIMRDNPKYDKEYLPIEGDSEFIQAAMEFAYGGEIYTNHSHRIAAVQALSGTGACRIGGQFLSNWYKGSKNIYIPIPTWNNHYKVFGACGLITKSYRYYDEQGKRLDFDGLLEDLNAAEDGSIIVLHACAHNPTGCDPTTQQWEHILDLILRKRHVVFFDSAYQGFASGDAERDASAVRLFFNSSVPILLAQSFAKNFGLYGERVGLLSVKCSNAAIADKVQSQLKAIVRPMYSSPPKHGSSIVKIILRNQTLKDQYLLECKLMSDRISEMRKALVDALQERVTSLGTHSDGISDWSHILSPNQIGMFAYTGMTSTMVDELTSKHAIYMTRDGRISLAGLNPKNLPYVANAIHSVTTTSTNDEITM